jgi:hypothetical protein
MNHETCRKDIPYPSVSNESVPSLINNLVTALYGSNVTKSVVNRQVIWNIPCDPNNTAQISSLPRNQGEGLLCYLIRAFNTTFVGQVTLDGVQTLTNKTLTAPVINSPSVANLSATGTLSLPLASILPSYLSLGAPSWTSQGVTSIIDLIVSGNLTLPNNSITSGMIADGTITNADISSSAAIANSKLAGLPDSTNQANKIVLRDGSGNFAANIVTANLTGIASNATNVQGGALGSIPYQSALNTTALLATGSAGQVLICGGNAAPSWGTDQLGTTNTAAITAGYKGEYVVGQVTNAVSITQNSAKNIASISLTAGDWDVSGSVTLAYTTTNSATFTLQGGINTTADTIGAQDTYSQFMVHAGSSAAQTQAFSTPVVRISISSATTIYLVGFANGGLSSITGKGAIRARRMR